MEDYPLVSLTGDFTERGNCTLCVMQEGVSLYDLCLVSCQTQQLPGGLPNLALPAVTMAFPVVMVFPVYNMNY